MKILHINTYDITGGAARAAYRLHKGMLKSNIDSLMLVNNQHVYDEDILELSPLSKTYEVFDQISSYISNQFFQKYYRPKSDFSIIRKLPTNLPNVVKKINPDIIHLHWINEQFINLDELSQLNKPVIWTLHDMWAMTGGCHYNGNCFAYLDKCGKCPILKSSKVKDLSYRQFQDKLNSYAKINNFCINGVSSWIANEAKKSSLLRFNQIVNLPNTLDVSIYKPFNSSFSRSTLQLSLEKKIVLLGASYSTSDDRKGFHLLVQALQMLPNKNNIQILISGNAIKENFFSGFEVKFIGYVNDDYTLALLYSAADLVVLPSRQENLSNTVLEALSCGTPVVCFAIGGNSDMLDHKHNGYLAKPYNCQDLANGLEFILNHPNPTFLAQNARDKVLNYFSEKIVVPQYIDLYQKMLLCEPNYG